jgi:chorismate synthase
MMILCSVVTGLGNSMGKLFKVTTFGESHGSAIGVTIDGCPPRIPITMEDIQKDLNRRKPGQSKLTTPRQEDDKAEILSGIEKGLTTGMPISILVRNEDHKSDDYDEFSFKYRPSHADATYDAKFGIRSIAGGGRASARETIGNA